MEGGSCSGRSCRGVETEGGVVGGTPNKNMKIADCWARGVLLSFSNSGAFRTNARVTPCPPPHPPPEEWVPGQNKYFETVSCRSQDNARLYFDKM